jgi:hypothetical protein
MGHEPRRSAAQLGLAGDGEANALQLLRYQRINRGTPTVEVGALDVYDVRIDGPLDTTLGAGPVGGSGAKFCCHQSTIAKHLSRPYPFTVRGKPVH